MSESDESELPVFRRIICGGCECPNGVGVACCSKCGREFGEGSREVVCPCPFCALFRDVDSMSVEMGIQDPPLCIGKEVVRYVSDRYLAFDALHSVSDMQINIIPRTHIESLSSLDASDASVESKITLIQELHGVAMKVAAHVRGDSGNVWAGDEVYELGCETFTVGFNNPPSVPHLHLYVIGIPYNRDVDFMRNSALCFPRAKTCAHVLESLETSGMCLVACARPEEDRDQHAVERGRIVDLHVFRQTPQPPSPLV